ncbi:2-oxo-4-hydroxy-4-carboxy-5-ureidoimidazoline decarboxylase [Streptomyces sp. ACA25]|uniref:2-oxo-4-hydroxy-4-carboxy-5-ureidoimidazoline decarboxylase n=1 Tax=Streptomyces sp. ACA25 TaxID=3022596 RepID=UPI0023076DA8|nr:2-oxo-4-hydroxy-4-carboxy-5-ureidoimidazoline decarboxylase [Streptomyces sp. ACA25]MDB1087068.1 2-oxo-4-hydroxy-4-carboxy-5-ureidoimidazoline decarboxylase [Streptomyces sp. ACA25]
MRPLQRGTPAPLDHLNDMAAPVAEAVFLTCCGSRRWASRMTAQRPYRDVADLLTAGDAACHDMSESDLDEALTAEARGPRPPLPDRSPPRPGAQAAHTALRAGHADYENRFGHPFVLCLDGLPAQERLDCTLTAIHRRLGHDRHTERGCAAEELRLLARGRLARLAGSVPGRVPGLRPRFAPYDPPSPRAVPAPGG